MPAGSAVPPTQADIELAKRFHQPPHTIRLWPAGYYRDALLDMEAEAKAAKHTQKANEIRNRGTHGR